MSVRLRVEKAFTSAEKLMGSGYVEARDISEHKVTADAGKHRAYGCNQYPCRGRRMRRCVDPESVKKADIVLADVPCSGLGVIGKKQDIKYKMSLTKAAGDYPPAAKNSFCRAGICEAGRRADLQHLYDRSR